MDEKISAYINDLRKNLEGMPQEEIREAVAYYEEYLYDAMEAGKDPDAVIGHLGTPQKIAAVIRTETSILRAQKNPGLRNFTRVLGNALHIVTTPLALLLMTTFVVISFSLVISFFVVSVATFVGAVAFVLGLGYQAFTAASKDAMGIIGALGLGLFGAGILLLLSYLFYKSARLLIRASTRVIRWVTRKPGSFVPEAGGGQETRKHGWKRTILACTAPVLAGLIMFSASGVPLTYFMIFNSEKPRDITVKTEEFEAAQVKRISLTATHTNIRLVRGTGSKIKVSCEKAYWLDQALKLNGDELTFTETSNGRLPLFPLVQLHESSAELTVSIPEGYTAQIIDLKTYGGFINIEGVAQNINAEAVSGSISIDNPAATGSYNLKASTGSGFIEMGGAPAGQRTDHGWVLERNSGAYTNIELHSDAGSISIK